MTDYRTPEGKRAIFCQTSLISLRQHLSLDGLFADWTACGHPVGHWSTGEIRTPIGMTCRTCIRNVTKHGRHRTAPGAWLARKLLVPPLLAFFDWRERRNPQPKPEPISTDELFTPKKDED